MPGGSALRGVPCRHHRLWGPGCHRRRSLIAVKGPVTTASSSARPPATNSATCRPRLHHGLHPRPRRAPRHRPVTMTELVAVPDTSDAKCYNRPQRRDTFVRRMQHAMSKPLHLPDLTITGFRGIDQLSIPRLGRVTLLAGKNGVGKTTALEASRVFAARGRFSALPE